MERDKTAIGLLLVSLFFLFGAFTLLHNQAPYFAEVNQAYKDKDAVNLDKELSEIELTDLFLSHQYYADSADAACIAKWMLKRLDEGGGFANLGSLNLNANKMKASNLMQQGGAHLRKQVAMSRDKLGVVDSLALHRPLMVTPGDSVIVVTVTMKDTVSGWRGLVNKVIGRDEIPVKGVPVRLTEYFLQTSSPDDVSSDPYTVNGSVVGWAMTDADGKVVFPVHENQSYSVVPVRNGFEYGREKGTVNGSIHKKNTKYHFEQKEHKMSPLDPVTYSRIKEDRALTVRTPSQWKDGLVMAVIIFLLSWWIGFFIIRVIDRKLGKLSDGLLLVALMTMTAISLLAMFSISDPLVDRLLGYDMAWGVLYGVLALVVMSSINYVKFYLSQSRVQGGILKFDFIGQVLNWIVKPFRSKKSIALKNESSPTGSNKKQWKFVSIPQGIGYIIMAMVLVVLLWLFGTGPEGSGARVNLGPLQPSEISKYLVVVFMAAFFASNADKIRSYATQIENVKLKLKFQLRTIAIMVCCLGVLLGCYVKMISDMGPALVLIITFVFIYSIARGDFRQLVLGVITFVITLMFSRWVNPTTKTMTMFALLWFAAWFAFGWLKGKRIYESAVVLNLFILIFINAGSWLRSLGLESEGLRLGNRVAASWSGVWNNEVPGGDQVAQGLWSLAAGGLWGQGLGKGNANLVPAFHTDMILLSIGEIMGWVTLGLILVCLVLIIHRSLLLALRSGHPFLFYLVSGIAIVTGVQFFVIVMGSIGLIPLTGVAVPLLSYGKSSLIMNLAAFGIIISCSRVLAGTHQKKRISQYVTDVTSSSRTFMILSIILAGTLFYYQFVHRNSTLIRPAYVCDMQGNRLREYNPRILLLINRLNAGNIYDRNGVLLATSDPAMVLENIDQLDLCGLNRSRLEALSRKRLRRYYPFAEELLFMIGDLNTQLLWGSDDADPYGYLAEKRHLSQLRGFDNLQTKGKVIMDSVTMSYHVYNRFMPTMKRRDTKVFVRYNYEELLPLLKSGIKSKKVKRWNEERNKRDLTLTIDANLQHLMQGYMADMIHNDAVLKNKKSLRASVVVLDVHTGDLLTSSCYPLPDQEIISQRHGPYSDNQIGFKAYTDRDLGLTYQTQPGSTAKVMSALAGFMKLGDAAGSTKYQVFSDERIHQGIEPEGEVSIHDAIVKSSNNFFVHFVNDKDLHAELDRIYRTAGIRLHIKGRRSLTPYFFDIDTAFNYGVEMDYLRSKSIAKYTDYMSKRNSGHERFNWSETGHAWGQHSIYATPLNMARIVSMVANNGKFVPTRYVLEYGTGDGATNTKPADAVKMVSKTNALYSFMQDESDKHRAKNYKLPGSKENKTRMGGKTGTPERYQGKRTTNDAWYICFINSNKQHGPLAIAVRLERTGMETAAGSAKAVDFVSKAVVPALNAAGYNLQ